MNGFILAAARNRCQRPVSTFLSANLGPTLRGLLHQGRRVPSSQLAVFIRDVI